MADPTLIGADARGAAGGRQVEGVHLGFARVMGLSLACEGLRITGGE
jgi:hypothetical protein